MSAIYLYGWDSVNEKWVKLQVNPDGKIITDATEIIDDTPEDGATGKAISSNWAHDHKADASAHHAKYTDDDARASINNIFASDGQLASHLICNYYSIKNIHNFILSYSGASTRYMVFENSNNSTIISVVGYIKTGGYDNARIRLYNGTTYHFVTTDEHDHTGGNGAQINHTTLSNIGTTTHAQIDSYIADTIARLRVYMGATQTINAGAYNKVQFNSETFDNFNEFDNTTNYRFTAATSGVYQIDVCLIWQIASWAVGKVMYIYLFKNGSLNAILYEYYTISTNSSSYIMQGSDILSLAANDYIEVYAQNGDTSNQTLQNSSSLCRLYINKLK